MRRPISVDEAEAGTALPQLGEKFPNVALEIVRPASVPADGEGEAFLRAATQVKNVWIPYGE